MLWKTKGDYFSSIFSNSSITFFVTPVWIELFSETLFLLINEQKLRKKLAASNPIPLDLTPSPALEVNVPVLPPPALPYLHQTEEVEVSEVVQEQSNHVVEAAPAAPVQTTVMPPGLSREELGAIKIQTAFRGYLVI